MNKCFNINGICYPDENYMVDMEARIKEMVSLIESKQYFVVNRGRQYGKTTLLSLLARKLVNNYLVFFISFEGIGDSAYENEEAFCRRVCGLLYDTIYYGEVTGVPETMKDELYRMSLPDSTDIDFRVLSNYISGLCKAVKKPVVLIIDEVDQTSNHAIFLGFLGMLRDAYLKRRMRPTFQSVILAGVYDIKNLKLKIRKEEQHQYNSPWNIAARFDVDMSFSVQDIIGMLEEYEQDYHTGMNITKIAEMIYDYTSGYPYMVSYICKFIDEKLTGQEEFADKTAAWTREGILRAVKSLTSEKNTLTDDMIKKLAEYTELRQMLKSMLFKGLSYSYNTYNSIVDIGAMFGFIKERNGNVAIANRIFETQLYDLFISEEVMESRSYCAGQLDKNQFIVDGYLDMERVLEKFTEHFTDIYSDSDETFLEENGRRFFLLYLKPIINGVGNYYVEARTRDMRRTDVVIDYRGRQYVVEMKIWHGEEYNRRGEEQLVRYLEDYHLDTGYLLSFYFNKNKTTGVKKIQCGNKTVIEAVV